MRIQNLKKPARPSLSSILCFVVPGFLFLSCAQFSNRDVKPGPLSVSTHWVRDSLATPNTGFRKINRMSPLLYKNLVIVGNSIDGIVAYTQDSGQEVWRIAIPQGVEASGTVIKDRLFVGSNNGRMYSIDLGTAQTLWTFDTKSEIIAEPLLLDGILYFLSASQSIFALDAVTGKQQWTYNRQDTANLMTIRSGSRPSYSNGTLYLGFSDGSLVALNAKTGTQQWEIYLNKNTRFKDIDASPVVNGDFIYINSYDDKLYCVSKTKGEIIWSAKSGGVSTPLVVGDKIIFSTSKGEMISLAKSDGHEIWKYKTENGILTDPILFRGFVVAGESQGRLLLLDILTGELKGSFEPGRGVFSKPTADLESKLIYFISGEGNIYSIHADASLKASIYYLKN